jgi:acyl carrier protein
VLDRIEFRAAAREAVTAIVRQKVRDDEALVSSGLIDSLSILNLILSLQRQLGIQIPTADVQPEDFDSIDLITETLARVCGG